MKFRMKSSLSGAFCTLAIILGICIVTASSITTDSSPLQSEVNATKPPFSRMELIKMALNSTPKRRMTISEIYRYVETNFPYYKTDQNVWKNDIRIILSRRHYFKKIPKDCTEASYSGCYWTMDLQVYDALTRKRDSTKTSKSKEPGETEETFTKPPFSFVELIKMAINSVPERRMTVSQIYRFITHKFPYYREDQKEWKNAVRGTLSYRKNFRPIGRDLATPPGKGIGCYWAETLNSTNS